MSKIKSRTTENWDSQIIENNLSDDEFTYSQSEESGNEYRNSGESEDSYNQRSSGMEDGRRTEDDVYWWATDEVKEDSLDPDRLDAENDSENLGTVEGTSSTLSPESVKPKKTVPVDVTTFRYFERKVLSEFVSVRRSTENLRRQRLLEKCQMVRKVEKPIETLFTGKTKLRDADQDDNTDEDAGSAGGQRDYTEKEWAMKTGIEFLSTAGCSSSSGGNSYDAALKAAKQEANFRLGLYEKKLKRHRGAIGNAEQGPPVSDAFRRNAERAIWRAVIDSTKPRFPLPRFIQARHRYLKKVQSQFLGPGTYDIDGYDELCKCRKDDMPSQWSSCSNRFPKDKVAEQSVQLRDPWETFDKATYKYKNPGIGIPFESTPKCFRKGLLNTGCHVPANAYNIKSPLEEFLKKQTSLRGPYDCYTPSRGVIPYGYHKSPDDTDKCRLGPGTYEVRTSLVKEMNDSYSFFKGKFGKASRESMFGFKAAFDKPLWPRKNDIPSVGQYNPDKDTIGRDKKQNKAPFKVLAGFKHKDVRNPELFAADYYFYPPWTTWAAPDLHSADLKSVFKSRVPQISKYHNVIKERNKPINRKFDLESGVPVLEIHAVDDQQVKYDYAALEGCKCASAGGPKVTDFVTPGHGVVVDEKGQILTGNVKCSSCK